MLQSYIVRIRRGGTRLAGEGISLVVILARAVHDTEVELRQLFYPTSLTTGELPLSFEPLQAPMVTKDLEGYAGELQLGAPFFQASNNSQELFIVDFIVTFRGDHAFTKECDRV